MPKMYKRKQQKSIKSIEDCRNTINQKGEVFNVTRSGTRNKRRNVCKT